MANQKSTQAAPAASVNDCSSQSLNCPAAVAHSKAVPQDEAGDAIEALFEEIATTAYLTEERLKITPTDDAELQAYELDVLRRIVRRLGWIADMGLHRVGSNRTIYEGDAAAWLLSPYTNECLAQKVPS